MTGVLDVTLDGDTAGCRATAAALDRLGRALETAHATLVTQSRASESAIGGLAGIAYRAQAGRLAHACGVRQAQCEGLSRGLLALADELSGCLGAMRGICERARARLRVSGPLIHAPVAGPDGVVDPAAARAWRAACGEVSDVRRREGAAQAAWEETLRRWTPAPWPAGSGTGVGAAVGAAGAATAGTGPGHHLHHHHSPHGGVTPGPGPVPVPVGAGVPSAGSTASGAAAPPAPHHHHHHHHQHLAVHPEPWGEVMTVEPTGAVLTVEPVGGVLTVDPVTTDQPPWPVHDDQELTVWSARPRSRS